MTTNACQISIMFLMVWISYYLEELGIAVGTANILRWAGVRAVAAVNQGPRDVGIRATPSVVVGKILPRIAIRRIILANGAPLPFRHVRTPMPPVFFGGSVVCHALSLGGIWRPFLIARHDATPLTVDGSSDAVISPHATRFSIAW